MQNGRMKNEENEKNEKMKKRKKENLRLPPRERGRPGHRGAAALTFSTMTASHRCDGAVNVDVGESQPIWCVACALTSAVAATHLSSQRRKPTIFNFLRPKYPCLFQFASAMVKGVRCHVKQLVGGLMYRIGVVPKDVNADVAAINTKRTSQLVDW